eukprot:12098860-Alexandrium_andersonii.AAC.1
MVARPCDRPEVGAMVVEERPAPAAAEGRPAGGGGQQLSPGMVRAQALENFTVSVYYIMLRR